jgi:WD40 repeat protein
VVAGPFAGHTSFVTSVGFSPDGKRVVSGSLDKTIRIWDSEAGEAVTGPFRGQARTKTQWYVKPCLSAPKN